MDAIKFLEERARMCGHGCKNCHVYGDECDMYSANCDYESLVKAVEAWSAAHPRKTRQSEFLKQWPDASIDKTTGVLDICPAALTKECRDDKGVCGPYSIETCVCKPCRREFWMQEVE